MKGSPPLRPERVLLLRALHDNQLCEVRQTVRSSANESRSSLGISVKV